MNLAAIRTLASTARQCSRDDDAVFDLDQQMAELERLLARDPEDLSQLHQRTAREAVRMAEQLLVGRAPVIATPAELARPGAVERLQGHFDQVIADAKAGL